MNILIAGGSGFLGTALANYLSPHHKIFILTRRTPQAPHHIQWDAQTAHGWSHHLNNMDAVINLTGYGLDHWPWTQRQKKRFSDSRVLPGLALAEAFEKADRRPGIFLQASGINHYGLHGDTIADELTPSASDFLAQLTIAWEDATKPIEALGVRRIITRNAVICARQGGLFPLLALPVRLFVGGKFGSGLQAINWMHIKDYVRAIQFLIEHETAQGVFNMIAPRATTNAEFMGSIAKALHRPYWLHLPKWLLQLPLGEMNVTLTEGRPAQPKRLLELGYQFEYGELDSALKDLLSRLSLVGGL
jgi:uncharacterized protein (TIGR01777 family)